MGYQALDLEWILSDFYIERQVFLQGARSITARCLSNLLFNICDICIEYTNLAQIVFGHPAICTYSFLSGQFPHDYVTYPDFSRYDFIRTNVTNIIRISAICPHIEMSTRDIWFYVVFNQTS